MDRLFPFVVIQQATTGVDAASLTIQGMDAVNDTNHK